MKKGMMISCKDATKLVIKQSEEELSGWDKFRLAFHLAICKFCKLFQKQNKMIDESIKELVKHTHEHLNESAKKRIIEEVLK